MNTIKSYSAYLIFSPLSENALESIRSVFCSEGLGVDVNSTSLEFDFHGRDLDDRIIQCFLKTAAIVGDADGEIRCEIDDEKSDPDFAFYSIRDGKLYKQTGSVVRSDDISEVRSKPGDGT